MSAKSKRRWYQFSILTLLIFITVVATVLGSLQALRSHRRFCVERSRYHSQMYSIARFAPGSLPNFELSEVERIEIRRNEAAMWKRQREYHLRGALLGGVVWAIVALFWFA